MAVCESCVAPMARALPPRKGGAGAVWERAVVPLLAAVEGAARRLATCIQSRREGLKEREVRRDWGWRGDGRDGGAGRG